MRVAVRSFLGQFAIAVLAIATTLSGRVEAQLTEGAIIVPEFFEELYQIPTSGGTAIDLLDSPVFDEVAGQHLAIADADTAYIMDFSDLYRFDFSSGQITHVDQLSFTPLELTLHSSGDLIAVAPDELVRVDPTTGAESSLYTEDFFGPSDAVSDPDGNIFLTEFFDALGVFVPGAGFTQVGNFPSGMFGHVDLGPDGMLYLATSTEASFYRVDPSTGVGVELDSEVYTFIDDLQVDSAGDILFSGEVNEKMGVFRFDPDTKALTTIVDNTSVNDGFFNPNDIAIFSADTEFASADFDKDGDVDIDDLVRLRAGYGSDSTGDTDSDNDTDGADVLAWQQQYTGSGGLQSVVVPEPSSAGLFIASLFVCSCCKCR